MLNIKCLATLLKLQCCQCIYQWMHINKQQIINHYDHAYVVYLIVYLLRKTLKSHQKSVKRIFNNQKEEKIEKKFFLGILPAVFHILFSQNRNTFPLETLVITHHLDV